MDADYVTDLVELYGKAIYGFCYNLTKDKNDADDLYQETFLKGIKLCHKIDKNNNPKGLLISIAIGIWKNNRRKYVWRQKIAPLQEFNEEIYNEYISNDEMSIEDIILSNELRLFIQDAANRLNSKMRIPLYMYYTADMSIKEIASALKIPQGTVKSRLFKARKELKDILELEAGNYERF
ncbi:RNA polymerase sigma factor [Vallitalea longa]|uniref:RNA polymerase sigma factor n=1 Tax=Vallitalea longa TaxID=2936439 RepID=A0A9W5YAC3_9FIRM|nr:RNA polymerase sigma factor [Vallitalea longa]GKX27643.1 RNA polymerase sigma factor [Vallitalea longa]